MISAVSAVVFRNIFFFCVALCSNLHLNNAVIITNVHGSHFMNEILPSLSETVFLS
jgi:hypothetical protein